MDVFDYECGPKCHSKWHATELNSVITQSSLPEIQAYFQLCHSAGHQADLDGRTPLHLATVCGKLDVVEWLLEEKKVDINAVDRESKWTALHKAMFYGQIGIARFLIQNSALLSPFDNEGMQALELLLSDRPKSLSYSHEDSNEVFLWGENPNGTLGHSSEQRRPIPTPVDTFRRQNLNVKQVLLRKYHTVFLTQCGSVYTCGHGQDGRLGLGNENTYLIPQRIESLKSDVCVQIAASINHTVILTEKGSVYSCGLNNHQQLCQYLSPSKCLMPRMISIKPLKGQKPKGICVSQYHTVLYTEYAIFSVGFNGGQLGFPKSERYQVQLRPAPLFEQVSRSNKEKKLLIDQVTCSDAATVCLTNSGDIFVLHEFQCRKIPSSQSKIVKIDVTGGNLDLSSEVCSSPTSPTSSGDKTSSLTTGAPQLVIMVLTENGMVSIWRSLNPILRCCLFNIRNLFVSDICLSDSKFGFVTLDGRAFIGSWKNIKKVIKEKVTTKEEENPFIHHTKRRTAEMEEIEVCRIPYIHRASSIAINREGNNFAVTQVNPLKSIDTSFPEKISGMTVDFKELMDSHWYDVRIKCGQQIWTAHRYIVAFHSNYFRKRFFETYKTTSDLHVSVGYIHNDLMKQLFQFFYTATCDLTTPGVTFVWTTQEKQYIDFDFFTKLSSSDNDSPNAVESNNSNSSKEHSIANAPLCNDPLSLLRLIANKFEIWRLLDRLKTVKLCNGVVNLTSRNIDVHNLIRLRFDRLKLPEFSDITIKAEDGREFKCHRCVLIARSEYFCSMLTNDWLEASISGTVNLQFSADPITILLDYLYTNEVPTLFANKTLDLLCEVLVMADQLLLTELKDISEEQIITLINLKNVGEILEFSCLYNADHLKKTCMQTISLNLAFMLESKFLDVVSDEIINELTKFYRKMVDSISRRLVTPFSSGPEKTYLESLVTYLRSNKQTNLKSDSGCKHKFNKRRPRVKTKSVSEEDFIQPNKSNQMRDVIDEPSNNHFTAEYIPERKKDESTPQKSDRLAMDSTQKMKRNKSNPWNILTSPVMAEVSVKKQAPENGFLAAEKIVTLADIMAEQNSSSQPASNHQGWTRYKKQPRKSIPKSPPVTENKGLPPLNNPWLKSVPKSPSASESKCLPPSPPSNNPWLKQTVNQENISPKPNFYDIVQDELQKVNKSVRTVKKPLKYIQIEEKAIEELLRYYSTDCSFEENISINRETITTEQPIWGRKQSLLF